MKSLQLAFLRIDTASHMYFLNVAQFHNNSLKAPGSFAQINLFHKKQSGKVSNVRKYIRNKPGLDKKQAAPEGVLSCTSVKLSLAFVFF